MSDTLDDILHIANDPKKKKAAKKVVPASSKSTKTSVGIFDIDDTEADDVTGMGSDDIMKYIQRNQATGDDDLELF